MKVIKNEKQGLEEHGLKNLERIYWHLPTPALYEMALQRREGILAHLGPLVVRTGHHTGRSPRDRFIVKSGPSSKKIWWGPDNQPIEKKNFEHLYRRMVSYFQSREVYVQECYVGASAKHRRKVRVITEKAWHSLFARNMLIRELNPAKLKNFTPDITVIHAPGFHAIPEVDGTNSETFVILNLEKKLIIIGGTSYAGEIKKAVFTLMNYILPSQNVLTMHCAANMGNKGDVAIFFGLSGTGKTTLSTDPERYLIGDDEHGWSSEGIFNLEGGCYAKVIRLSKESEPEIYECTRKFGTILENVAIDIQSRRVNLDDNSLTENTRASYPITHLPRIVREGTGPHPKNIIFLTYDAFGVLPPVAKLTPAQAMYHFVSGYTAKVAGTEVGVKEPRAVFSACFGAPFMILSPVVYAEMLRKKIVKHNVNVYLVNTGLTGGKYGTGRRFSIKHTRQIIKAILDGELDNAPFKQDKNFKFLVPERCPGVPQKILFPEQTWKNKQAFNHTRKQLIKAFNENIEKYKNMLPEDVLEEGDPKY